MEIIATGKTPEQAIEKGLKELNLTENDVDIEVVSKGSILSNAKVKISTRKSIGEKAEEYILALLEKMGFTCTVDVTEDEEGYLIDIIGTDTGAIIGYRGEVLDSIQYLTFIAANKGVNHESQKRIIVDCEGYREKRKNTLIELANSHAKKVAQTKRSYRFEPMNPNERRIIHTALQNNGDVETYSEGEEPNRRVIIKIKGLEEEKPIKKNNTRYTKEVKFRSFGGKNK